MNITVPVHVSIERVKDKADLYRVRPLFFAEPRHGATHLSRALAKLAQSLLSELREVAKQDRHETLARWAFCPPTRERSEVLHFALRSRTVKQQFHFIELPFLDRRLVFAPEVPGLWFEIEGGAEFTARAVEVLTRYWQKQEKEDPERCAERLKGMEAISGSWVTSIEVDVPIPKPKVEETTQSRILAAIFEAPEVSGETELRKVGLCLDGLYPDELDRALLREKEVEDLCRLLSEAEIRPVVLLGRRQVGKTAVLHEAVRRRMKTQPSDRSRSARFWQLAPQRLVAGMMYVGQWEERLLAILEVAREKDLVLCFDDVLGLYSAGVTAESDLSVAHVLKPYVERQECRVLAEMTPEAWRVFRERDRGFADLFHVLRIEEPREDDVHRMLIHSLRELEKQYDCRFEVDVIPTVVDLQRRFVKDAAFPGKATVFLRSLAVDYPSKTMGRDEVLFVFYVRNGLSVDFVDPRRPLSREAIRGDLERRVLGQPEAVEAMTDAVCVAKARLNDPGKPLANLLFLGPTGVGKTECAKALAAHLFGDKERLIRFDMNEYLDADHAAQLSGTFQNPEGLLTSAVRSQPFSVILFDEIEKAHPDVFDLLLQVIGEGRLTDALGRTSDFTNSVIIMTSNLGVRESRSLQGFVASGEGEAPRAEAFMEAARHFFRPEFLNRIDRVVPFGSLRREDLREIADREVRGILARGGLQQRKCAVEVFPEVLELVVDEGYHPELGARALKRALRERIVQPLAATLATATPRVPVYVRVYPTTGEIRVHVQELDEEGSQGLPIALPDLKDGPRVLRELEQAFARMESEIISRRPGREVNLAIAGSELGDYFLLRDRVRSLKARVEEMEERRAGTYLPRPTFQLQGRLSHSRLRDRVGRRHLEAIANVQDVAEYLRGCLEHATPLADSPEEALEDLVGEARLLDAMARHLDHPEESLCFLSLRQMAGPRGIVPVEALLGEGFETAHGSGSELIRVLNPPLAFKSTWLGSFEVQGTWLEEHRAWTIRVQGPGATELCALQEGWMLGWGLEGAESGEGTSLFLSERVPVPLGEDVASVLRGHFQKRQTWIDDLASGRATMDQDPVSRRPVIRIVQARTCLDLRMEIIAVGTPLAARKIILPLLPLPPELMEGRR